LLAGVCGIYRCEDDIAWPKYLRQGETTYILHTLSKPENQRSLPNPTPVRDWWNETDSKSSDKRSISSDEGPICSNEFSSSGEDAAICRDNTVTCDLLDPRTWPSKESLGLNESQLNAFTTALTQEFSVIQGKAEDISDAQSTQ